jgi:hypothetical protein
MKAYELLSQPGAWTQGTLARDSEGLATNVMGPTACSFCIAGAIERCYPCLEDNLKALDQVKQELKTRYDTFQFVGKWNDHPDRKHEEVVELLKKLDI